MQGVSVVICCHNSAARLSVTLGYLRRQEVSPSVRWEIVVVDNASTDGTAGVALDSWPKEAPASLRVVNEPRLGLSHARNRGFSEANYEIISFIDDDNWVCPNWIELVSEIMTEHPDMAACGGLSEAAFEIEPPWWFESYKRYYAIGAQSDEVGDISNKKGSLWGAGLSIRKSAWQHLLNRGFRSLLVDRHGTNLSTGGDSELSYALRLVGWGLWYDPRLRIRHYLPADRLQWRYLRKRFRGEGAASVIWDLYHYALTGDPRTLEDEIKRTWHWKIFTAFLNLLLYGARSFISRSAREGNSNILLMETRIGRLSELLRIRKVYHLTFSKQRLNQLTRGNFFARART